MGTFIYSVCAVWTKSFLFICRRLHAEAEALQPDQSPNIQLERTVHWYRFRRQCSHAQISTSVWFFNSKPSSSRCSTHTCQLLRPAAGEANPPRTLLLLCIDGEEYFSCWPPGHERFECKSQRLHRSKTVLDRRRQKCRYKLYCSLNNLHKSKWLLHTQGWTQPRERNRKRVEWRRHTHPHSAHKALMKSSLHQGCNTAPGQHRTSYSAQRRKVKVSMKPWGFLQLCSCVSSPRYPSVYSTPCFSLSWSSYVSVSWLQTVQFTSFSCPAVKLPFEFWVLSCLPAHTPWQKMCPPHWPQQTAAASQVWLLSLLLLLLLLDFYGKMSLS